LSSGDKISVGLLSEEDRMTKLFHFLLEKVALKRLQGDPCLPEQAQHLIKVL